MSERHLASPLQKKESLTHSPKAKTLITTLTSQQNHPRQYGLVFLNVSKNFRCMIIYFALISPYWYLRLKGLWLMYPAPPSICFLFFSQCTYFYFSVFWILVCSILFILLIDILLLPYQQILQFNWYANKVMIILDGPVLSKNWLSSLPLQYEKKNHVGVRKTHKHFWCMYFHSAPFGCTYCIQHGCKA